MSKGMVTAGEAEYGLGTNIQVPETPTMSMTAPTM
jgi:hypothetical protein